MSDGGKGSKRRPSMVNDKRLLDNWDRIFNKDKDDTPTQPTGTTSKKKNILKTERQRRSRVVGRDR